MANRIEGPRYDLDNLGPAGSWHIRNTPEGLKQWYSRTAGSMGVTVTDVLLRFALEHEGRPMPQPAAHASPHASPSDSVWWLHAAQAIAALGKSRSKAAEAIRQAVVEYAVAQPRHASPHALPGPVEEPED